MKHLHLSFTTILLLSRIVITSAALLLMTINCIYAQQPDSSTFERKLIEESKVKYKKGSIFLTVQNVDIKRFPEISLIVEAVNQKGEPLDSISASELSITENGDEKKIISVKKISVNERVAVDFVIVLDVTATMQPYINGVRDNIQKFTQSLQSKGIDYKIGLVFFSDEIEKMYQPTADVNEFLSWMSGVRAFGGKDQKENALEALRIASRLDFRPASNKVFVLITDQLYHQAGEKGNGITTLTTESAIKMLREKGIRAFCIVPPIFEEYNKIARETRGGIFDLSQSFDRILASYSVQLTNLFAITYISSEPAIPDSINVAILNTDKQTLIDKTIPIVEIGRKLIIKNLLFPTGKSVLPNDVPELEILAEFMKNKPAVKILIEGHTDNTGNAKSNLRLSRQRADVVRKYLIVRKNISALRIKTVGYGDTRPLGDNVTDFGRNLNRRTEVVITDR